MDGTIILLFMVLVFAVIIGIISGFTIIIRGFFDLLRALFTRRS